MALSNRLLGRAVPGDDANRRGVESICGVVRVDRSSSVELDFHNILPLQDDFEHVSSEVTDDNRWQRTPRTRVQRFAVSAHCCLRNADRQTAVRRHLCGIVRSGIRQQVAYDALHAAPCDLPICQVSIVGALSP